MVDAILEHYKGCENTGVETTKFCWGGEGTGRTGKVNCRGEHLNLAFKGE